MMNSTSSAAVAVINSTSAVINSTSASPSATPSPGPSPRYNGTAGVVFCPVFDGGGGGGGGGAGGTGGAGAAGGVGGAGAGGAGGAGVGAGGADSADDDFNLLFEFVAYGVLLNAVGVLGILGNVISMIILSRPQMKSSINYLLIGLARCDTVLIVTSILLFGLPVVYPITDHLFNYYYKVYPLIAPVVYPVAMISQTVSVYLTLTVTLERFVAVCHPLRARSLCTYGRARAYVAGIVAFAVLYNITRFWEVRVHRCMHAAYGQYVYQVYPSELRNDRDYISIYIHWMYLVIMYFIPFGSLAVLNAAIYNQVRMANRERQRLSRLQKKEIGLATMLLCVVVVFLLCNVWALISNVAEAFYGITVDQLVKVSNLLVTINSSVNFVIYVIFGEKFKRLFFKLFFPRGVWMCGWHPADGRSGTVGGHRHGAIDDSEATCNGGGGGGGGSTYFECRQLSAAGQPPPQFDRSTRRGRNNHGQCHHGHHHHHRRQQRGGGDAGAAHGDFGAGSGNRRRGSGGGADAATVDSGLLWEHSTTITTVTTTAAAAAQQI